MNDTTDRQTNQTLVRHSSVCCPWLNAHRIQPVQPIGLGLCNVALIRGCISSFGLHQTTSLVDDVECTKCNYQKWKNKWQYINGKCQWQKLFLTKRPVALVKTKTVHRRAGSAPSSILTSRLTIRPYAMSNATMNNFCTFTLRRPSVDSLKYSTLKLLLQLDYEKIRHIFTVSSTSPEPCTHAM